jgi:hypothetical protein
MWVKRFSDGLMQPERPSAVAARGPAGDLFNVDNLTQKLEENHVFAKHY